MSFHHAVCIAVSVSALLAAANASARDWQPVANPALVNNGNPVNPARNVGTDFLANALAEQQQAGKIEESAANPNGGRKSKWERNPEEHDAKLAERLQRLEDRKRIDEQTAERIGKLCNAAHRSENIQECAEFRREHHKHARPDANKRVGYEERPHKHDTGKPNSDSGGKLVKDTKPEPQAQAGRHSNLQNDIPAAARQGDGKPYGSDLERRRLNLLSAIFQRMENPAGLTPGETQPASTAVEATSASPSGNPNPTSSPAVEDVSGPMFRTEDTSVNTGTARAAMQCQSQASQAAQTCQQALANVQGLTAVVYRAQLAAASTNNAGSCADMGNAASSSGAQMLQQQQACAAAVSACDASCGQARSAVSGVPDSKAYIQANTGTSLCSSAGSSASTMGLNIDQVKTAAVNASQCYEQLSGQKFVPQGAGAVGSYRSDSSTGNAIGANVDSNYSQGVDATSENPYMPDPKKLYEGDQQGGGSAVGSTNGLSDSIPDLNSKFQASSYRPTQGKKAPPPRQVGKPGAVTAVPNPGFFSRDAEAERRAKEFSSLPSLKGSRNTQAAAHRAAQRPHEMERFLQRKPAHSSEIGAKHTNIFDTITESYARNQELLNP